MQVSNIKRKIKFGEQELPDIEGLTGEQIIDHYSTLYPELTCGHVKSQEMEGDVLVLTIGSNVGTKA